METHKNNPLHGVTLEAILNHLVKNIGWQEMSDAININCFKSNPTVKSSLTFLRKTPWARAKVESYYLYVLREETRNIKQIFKEDSN